MSGLFQDLLPEILGQIFSLCTTDEGAMHYMDNRSRPRALEAPLLLGRICSNWRRLALSMPGLWCCIKLTCDLRDPSRTGAEDEKCLTAVKEFAARSCNLPLTICFHAHERPYYVFDLPLTIDELIRLSPRWKSLRTHGQPAIQFMRAICEGVPLLDNLEIAFNECDGRLQFDLDKAPKISRAHISGGAHALISSSPLSHLRSLTLETDNSFTHLVGWVRRCPALEYLAIELNSGCYSELRLNDHSVHHQIHLPRLAELTLSCSGPEEYDLFQSLFDGFHMPNLQSLTLKLLSSEFLSPSLNEVFIAIIAFLRRDAPPLHSIDIECTDVCPETLVDVLAVLPSLRCIRLRQEVVEDDILSALTFWPRQPNTLSPHEERMLCPQLNELEIFVTDNTVFSEEAVVTMILSRSCSAVMAQHTYPTKHSNCGLSKKTAWLKKVIFSVYDESGSSVSSLKKHPDLQKCIAEGLEFKVCSEVSFRSQDTTKRHWLRRKSISNEESNQEREFSCSVFHSISSCTSDILGLAVTRTSRAFAT